jgi:hypothetical protein
MVPFESLQQQALGLAGSPSPNVRDASRLLAHLVKHVGALATEVADLRKQLEETRQALQRLCEAVLKQA